MTRMRIGVVAVAMLGALACTAPLAAQSRGSWATVYAGRMLADAGGHANLYGGQLGAGLVSRLGLSGDVLLGSGSALLASVAVTWNRWPAARSPGYLGLAEVWAHTPSHDDAGPALLAGLQLPFTGAALQLEGRLALHEPRLLGLVGLSFRL